MEKTYQSAGEITRRIGGTNYRVKIHYRSDAKENMQEKVLRLIQNDLDFFGTKGRNQLPRWRGLWYNECAADEPSSLKGVPP